MATTHTPGPWKAVPNPMRADGWFVVRDIPVQPYAGVTDLDGAPVMPLPPAVIRSQVNEADAHLIAAAPELLACLRRMCGMYGAYSRRLAPLLAEDRGTVWTFERANSLACEAIAKAEGAQ